jgi:hypothetical protein
MNPANNHIYSKFCKCIACTMITEHRPTEYITIDDLLAEGKVLLRNLTSRFDSKCQRCDRPYKTGDRIRWSKVTGGLCFPNCTTTYKNDLKLFDNKSKRQFDFGDDGE